MQLVFLKGKEESEKLKFSEILIFFLLIYGFSIGGVDMRYPFLICAYIYVTVRFKSFTIPRDIFQMMSFFGILASYALITATVNQTGDYFETLRLVRCIVTCILVVGFIYSCRLTPTKTIHLIEIILLFNAVVIILTILFPDIKPYFEVFNQYKKTYTRWRTIGLLNGEDAAGFFCNLGMIIETVQRVYKRKNPISWKSILFVAATVFTSRMAMLLTGLVLIVDLFIVFRRKEYRYAIGIFVLLLPIVIIGGTLWILTTNVAIGLRESIYGMFPFLRNMYVQLATGYVDYGKYTSIISRHTTIDLDLFHMILGAGYRTDLRKDVGYIKTIYSIGLVGVMAEVMFYLRSIVQARRTLYKGCPKSVFVIYVLIVLMMILWEVKNSFMFSSGVFELFTALFISMKYCSEFEVILEK